MSWLYRLFKRNVASTSITLDSSVTSGITVPALTVTGTTTQTGAETFTAVPISTGVATASPTLFKVFTCGGIDVLVGATPGLGTSAAYTYVPAHVGDVLICTTTGKIHVASGITASSDWKLVTSA
jgi:hypothetical protein